MLFIEFANAKGGIDAVPVPGEVVEEGKQAIAHWVAAECQLRGLQEPRPPLGMVVAVHAGEGKPALALIPEDVVRQGDPARQAFALKHAESLGHKVSVHPKTKVMHVLGPKGQVTGRVAVEDAPADQVPVAAPQKRRARPAGGDA